MEGGSVEWKAARASRRLSPELILSSPGTARLPPFISFSTSFPEPDSAVIDQKLANEPKLSTRGH